MISEMERLILKADLTSHTHPTNKKTFGSAQAVISQGKYDIPASNILVSFDTSKQVSVIAHEPLFHDLESNNSKSDVTRKSGLQRPTLTSHAKSSMQNVPCNQSTKSHGEGDFHSIYSSSSNDPNHKIAGIHSTEEEIWQNIKNPSASGSLIDASFKDRWYTESNGSQNLQENHLSHEYIQHIAEGENHVIPSKVKSSFVEAISAKELPRRKLSFIPSNALSKSLLRVAEDALDKGACDLSAITYETYMPSKHITHDQLLIDIDGTDGETQRDSSLFGVPEMLSVLKLYIEKSRSAYKYDKFCFDDECSNLKLENILDTDISATVLSSGDLSN